VGIKVKSRLELLGWKRELWTGYANFRMLANHVSRVVKQIASRKKSWLEK
jgi:hypothetical protein